MSVLGDVTAERRRQVADEGFAPARDDGYVHGQLARAASAYAEFGGLPDERRGGYSGAPATWPWALQWWKPTDRRRDLVKAAALIFAEIERLDRASGRADAGPRLVILESPYAGEVHANVFYARRCLRDSLMRGEAPIASHLLYTQPNVLNDGDTVERRRGIEAGLAWSVAAAASVVYVDRGISAGMRQGIATATAAGIPVEFREIGRF